MIELRKLKELVKLMKANDLTELDIQGDGERVTLKRAGPAPPHAPASRPAEPPPSPAPATPHAEAPTRAPEPDRRTITSPMVGTFYAAAGPDAEPFVNVGDHVLPDSVVAVVEAMKVFNEIKAGATGTVTRILAENGQAVEFDQPLFELAPGGD